MRLVVLAFVGLLLDPAASVAQTAPTGDVAAITEAQLEAFRPRLIGPAVTGGRVHDVEALPHDPSTIFVASASGGLWKITNRGHTPQVWIRHDDSQLARPIGTKGPWISPGTYTVTLEARGATFTQTVEVRGDPLLSAYSGAHQKKIGDRGSPRPHSPLHERRPLTAMSENDE